MCLNIYWLAKNSKPRLYHYQCTCSQLAHWASNIANILNTLEVASRGKKRLFQEPDTKQFWKLPLWLIQLLLRQIIGWQVQFKVKLNNKLSRWRAKNIDIYKSKTCHHGSRCVFKNMSFILQQKIKKKIAWDRQMFCLCLSCYVLN